VGGLYWVAHATGDGRVEIGCCWGGGRRCRLVLALFGFVVRVAFVWLLCVALGRGGVFGAHC